MAAEPKILYEFGPFRLDPDKAMLLREGQPLAITPKAFETLLALVRRNREVVTKDELMKAVWPDAFVEEGNLSQNIFLLRKLLGDSPEERRYIVTLPGKGYRFTADVRLITPEQGSDEEVVIHSLSRSRILIEHDDVQHEDEAGISLSAPPPAARLTWRSVLLACGLAIAIGAWAYLRRAQAAPPEGRTILVLEITNKTGDPSLDGGLRTALRLALAESPYYNLVSEAALALASKEIEPSPLPSQGATPICEKLKADVVIDGSVWRDGRGTNHVELRAATCGEKRILAREEARAVSDQDLLAALDHAADALRQDLGESRASRQQFRTPIEQASTSSLAALKAFTLGEDKRAQGQDFETVPLYRIATDLDPRFALAYARLGTIYANADESASARQHLCRAGPSRARPRKRNERKFNHGPYPV